MKEEVEKLSTEFFSKLDIEYDTINVLEEENNIYLVKLKTPESGLLIGPHGKNIDSLQLLLKLICSTKGEDRIKLHLEINDYMKSKDDRLQDFINSKIKYVEKSGSDLKLPFYSAYDRKKIHGFVGEYGNQSIFTKSIGEAKERRLYICKAAAKLTIDIDGDDI